MSHRSEGTHIGTGKRRLRQEEISYVMEAMPIPRGWNMSQPPATGRGNLRLCKGVIPFVSLDISLEELLPSRQKEYEPEPVSPVDFDPADKILRRDQLRRIRSRGSNIDLFDLERRIKSDNSVSSGRDVYLEDRELAESAYRNRQDTVRIRTELAARMGRMKFNLFEVSVITLFLSAMEVLPGLEIPVPGVRTPEGATVLYPIISLIGLCFASIVMWKDIREGMKNLFSRRFSSLTSIAAAILAELIHLVYILAAALIAGKQPTVNFAAPVCLAMLVYAVNRLLHTSRIAHGFAYVSKRGIHSEVVSADDSPIAADLRHASGSVSARIAYVVRTKHLRDYFRNACREDRCSAAMSRIYPLLLTVSVATEIIAGIRGYYTGSDVVNTALSAFSSALIIGIPITGMFALEIPLSRWCKTLRRHGALLTGWKAVDKFGDTDAFAVNTTDLFPRGSIRVRKSFAVNDMEIEEITSIAASVLLDSGGALAEVFGELIRDDPRLRQPVDGVTYETELGICAWVKDKKVLVGNRNMMELHRVVIPGGGLARLDEFDAMRRNDCFQMLYVAVNNRLMGVYMLEYKAAVSARNAMLQFIEDGTGIMVYTCDANINIQLIRAVFDIPPRFISIMENEGSSIYDSVTYRVTESQEAMIATDGSLRALSDSFRAAVVLRDAEGMGMMVQRICFGMGLLFVAGLSCISPYAIDSLQILIMQTVFLLLSLVSVIRSH